MTVSAANIGIVLLHHVNPHIKKGHARCIGSYRDEQTGATIVQLELSPTFLDEIPVIQEKLRHHLNNRTLIVEHV